MAISREGHRVTEGVVAQLPSLDLLVDLQILQRATLPAPPAVLLQYALLYPAVGLDPQLGPLSPGRFESRT